MKLLPFPLSFKKSSCKNSTGKNSPYKNTPAKIKSRSVTLLIAALLQLSCAQSIETPEIEQPPELVGEVTLLHPQTDPPEESLLDIGIVVFKTRSADLDTRPGIEQIFDQIKLTESQYLPTVLRNKLVATSQWGAVRVLPQADPSVDLLVAGTIIQSDGLNLELQIRAWDSTGRLWLDKTYNDLSRDEDYPLSSRRIIRITDKPTVLPDPFEDLYKQVANDLLLVRLGLSKQELISIGQVSQLQYARDLAPDSYGDHLLEYPDGTIVVNRLLAENDPMSFRVADMRLRHHLFIDTVDEYYADLHSEMKLTYDLWRQTSREQELAEQESREAAANSTVRRQSSSFISIRQSYNRYKWSKIYEQEFMQLAYAFNEELAPEIHELSGQVHRLSGSMEDRYLQWRDILRSLFEIETGQAALTENQQ